MISKHHNVVHKPDASRPPATIIMTLLILCALLIITMTTTTTALSICDPQHFMNSRDNKRYFDQFYPTIIENFDGPVLNESLWNVVTSDERQFYSFACGRGSLCTKDNVYIEDGQLVLRVKTNDTHVSPTNSSRIYPSSAAGVTSRDKIVVNQDGRAAHRICIRATLPHVKGSTNLETGGGVDKLRWSWPAVWTLGNLTQNWLPPPVPKLSSTFDAAADSDDDINAVIQQDVDAFDHIQRPLSFEDEATAHYYQGGSAGDSSSPFTGGGDDEPSYKVCNPDETELDLIEVNGGGGDIDVNLHWADGTPEFTCQFPKRHHTMHTTHDNVDRSVPHDFDVELGPDYMDIYLDGHLTAAWKVGRSPDYFNRRTWWYNNTAPFYFMFNNAFGGVGQKGKLDPEWIAKHSPKEIFFKIDHLHILRNDAPDHNIPFTMSEVYTPLFVFVALSAVIFALYYASRGSSEQ